MHRRLAAALCLAALLPLTACSSGGGPSADIQALQLAGNQMREDCVASTLDLMQHVADMMAPAVVARDLEALQEAAAAARCTMFGPVDGTYQFICSSILVRGESTVIVMDLTYYDADGFPTTDLADAVGMIVRIEAEGGFLSTEGLLDIHEDIDRGFVFEGALSSSFFDGCQLIAEFTDVTGRRVADLPGVATGIVFTSGDVDIGAQTADGLLINGSAGLIGRSALVVLTVDGVLTQGELELGLSE